MANGKNGKRGRPPKQPEQYRELGKWTGAIALITFGLILGLALFGLGGTIGTTLFKFACGFLGVFSYFIPVIATAIVLRVIL